MFWLAMVVAAAPSTQGVDGGLVLEAVSESLAFRAPDFGACLEQQPRARVRFEFGIDARGKVERKSAVEVKGVAPATIECIGAVIDTARFPSADAGTTAVWTFKLGGLDAGTVSAVTLAPDAVPVGAAGDVAHCYFGQSVDEGPMNITSIVSRRGFVHQVKTIDAPDGGSRADFVDCVRNAARAWTFAPAPTTREVTTLWTVGRTEQGVKQFADAQRPATTVLADDAYTLPTTPRGTGGLHKLLIGAIIRRHSSPLRACYEIELQKNRDLGGLVKVRWTIGPEGDVLEAEVAEQSLHNEAVTDCVLGVVKRMKFPKPIGGGVVNVTFPWIFVSSETRDVRDDDAVVPKSRMP